jgi:hypothetical protein
VPTKYETSIHSKKQLKNARTKGQVVGFAQGAATIVVLGFLLKFLGWIPAVLVLILVGFVIYKVVTFGGDDEPAAGS